MNQTALCPSCKRDVVFDVSDSASHCPACGARFEIASEATRRQRPRLFHGIIFVLWMFAPAVIALLAYALVKSRQSQSFDKFFSAHAVLAWVWFGLSCVSCYAACSWLTARFTKRRWARVLIGLFLGAGILFCNVVIAFFGACAFFR